MDAKLKELIETYCRYYKGEPECPAFSDAALSALWTFEKHWLELGLSGGIEQLHEHIAEYIKADPKGASGPDDIPPISLKALIFHHFAKNAKDSVEAVELFNKLIGKYYRSLSDAN